MSLKRHRVSPVKEDNGPALEIYFILNRYIEEDGEKFVFNGGDFYFQCRSLYQRDSKVSDSEFQKDLMRFLLTGPKPVCDRINITLNMIAEVRSAIEKFVSCGVYSEKQGATLIGILTEDFHQVISGMRLIYAEFLNTPKSVAFFERIKSMSGTEVRVTNPNKNRSEQICNRDYDSDKQEQESCNNTTKNKRLVVLLCCVCVALGIIGYLQKIQWMLVVFLYFSEVLHGDFLLKLYLPKFVTF